MKKQRFDNSLVVTCLNENDYDELKRLLENDWEWSSSIGDTYHLRPKGTGERIKAFFATLKNK